VSKIGFVGFGNMGGTMLRALLKYGALPANRAIVFNRTAEKLIEFSNEYPEVETAASLADLGRKSERVFVCTGTKEVKAVLSELAGYLPEEAHVVTITGIIELRGLERIYGGSISKIIPTMISEVGEGVTLVSHNRKVLPDDRLFINTAFSKLGKVKEISEHQFDLAADLTSCAPAFYAEILHCYKQAALKHGDLNETELNDLIIPTCLGTARLLAQGMTDYEGLISRVATRGGVSEEGVKILRQSMPEIFDKLLDVTISKRAILKKQMNKQYGVE